MTPHEIDTAIDEAFTAVLGDQWMYDRRLDDEREGRQPHMIEKRSVGARLLSMGWKQSDVADLLDITKSAVANWSRRDAGDIT